MKTLTIKVAKDFVQNYRGVDDPQSMSYCDGHAIAYLERQTKRYGYPSVETMNTACRIFLRHNKPAPKGKTKMRIEVVKYMGKFGSFASAESEMYRAELVGRNGKRQVLPDTRAQCTEYDGHPERKYADQTAKIWAALLGCEVISVDRTPHKKAA